MNNRLRWILWGILFAILVGIVLIVVFWLAAPAAIARDAIFVPRDVETLEEALAQANPGDTIAIQSSAGPIQGPIILEIPDLTLVASGGRVTVQAIGGSPTLSILADGVTLRGFKILSESIGMVVDAVDCTIEDIHIESASVGLQLSSASLCTIRSIKTQGGQVGIELIDTGNAVLEDAVLEGASDFGIRLLGSWANQLRNVQLSDHSVGISFEHGSTDNLVENSRIERCSIAGIEVQASNDNTIASTVMTSVRIGVVLEGVTGTEVRYCDLKDLAVAGIHLQQSIQNRVVETTIRSCQAAGIQLTQSSENALLYNRIADCRDVGISLVSSHRNLVLGNEMSDCLTGIAIARSDSSRILRNDVLNPALCGVFVSQGRSNQLLDNATTGGIFGIAIAESRANTVLRNRLAASEGAGLFLLQTEGEHRVSENVILDHVRGVVVVDAQREQITQNDIRSNEVGILIAHLDKGVRIEGNTIADNRTGLKQTTGLDGLEVHLEALGMGEFQPSGESTAALANNVFQDNKDFDIQNVTMIPLPAADNWWGEARSRDPSLARISDSVDVEQSAWRGTLAVGTQSDPVRVLLGRILQYTLSDAGFRVIDLVGIGPQDRVRQALAESDVDLIWWSDAANSPQLMDGSSPVTIESRAIDGWRVIVSSQMASQLAKPTMSELSHWTVSTGGSLRYASIVAFDEEQSEAFLSTYGLEHAVRSFTRAQTLEEVEALLKFGAVDVAIVSSLEETLTIAGFLEIEDDLSILDQGPITMMIQQATSTNYQDLESVLSGLGERLDSDVLHDLVSRIRLLHQDPEDVAREFVQQ